MILKMAACFPKQNSNHRKLTIIWGSAAFKGNGAGRGCVHARVAGMGTITGAERKTAKWKEKFLCCRTILAPDGRR